jgi:hypothetical protein
VMTLPNPSHRMQVNAESNTPPVFDVRMNWISPQLFTT